MKDKKIYIILHFFAAIAYISLSAMKQALKNQEKGSAKRKRRIKRWKT